MSCYSIDGRYTNREKFDPIMDMGLNLTEHESKNSKPKFTFNTPKPNVTLKKCQQCISRKCRNCHMEMCTRLEQQKIDLCDYLAHPSVKVPDSLIPTIEAICNKDPY